MPKSVTVIGGGVAGLSAAVFLAEEGFTVNLYEASPRLGGRAYSFFDKQFGARIDNGQHIFASWYRNTFDFLKIIGSYDKLYSQKQLEVNFTNQKAESYRLRASKLPPPFHLLKGLMSFKALELNDRLSAIHLINTVKSNKIKADKLKQINVNKLFSETMQTKKIVESFWKPFIIAVFNALPENTSAYMFSEIIRTGFIERGGSNLVLPDVFLSELLVHPAVEFLNQRTGTINTGRRIEKINIKDTLLTSIIAEDRTEIKSDYYICAIPFFEIRNLLNGWGILNGLGSLSPSPIVNIHIKFERDISSIINKRFYGILESNIQWVFRVSQDQICVVISSARNIAEMDKETIISLCIDELLKCFPDLAGTELLGTRVIKEMRATFVPDSESLHSRPESKTKIENLYLAGDWTNTGLPATIESAVKSARTCADLILHSVNQQRSN